MVVRAPVAMAAIFCSGSSSRHQELCVFGVTSSSFPTELYRYNICSGLNKQKQYPTLPHPSCATEINAECFMHWLVLPRAFELD